MEVLNLVRKIIIKSRAFLRAPRGFAWQYVRANAG